MLSNYSGMKKRRERERISHSCANERSRGTLFGHDRPKKNFEIFFLFIYLEAPVFFFTYSLLYNA